MAPCRRFRRLPRNALDGYGLLRHPAVLSTDFGLSPWHDALSPALAVKDVRLPKPAMRRRKSGPRHQLPKGEFDLGGWSGDGAGDVVGVVGEFAAVLLEDPRRLLGVTAQAFQLCAFEVEPAVGIQQLERLFDDPVGGIEFFSVAECAGGLEGGVLQPDDRTLSDVGGPRKWLFCCSRGWGVLGM